LGAEKLRALIKQQCKPEFGMELIAHDPLQVPQLRIFELSFGAVEDRDRAVITLRMAAGNGSSSPARAATPKQRAAAY
jgi:hypothetical protein